MNELYWLAAVVGVGAGASWWTWRMARKAGAEHERAVRIVNDALRQVVEADAAIFNGQQEAVKDLLSIVSKDPSPTLERLLVQTVNTLDSLARLKATQVESGGGGGPTVFRYGPEEYQADANAADLMTPPEELEQ